MVDTPAQVCDVCVVCALPEEARAFLAVVQPFCEGPIEARFSPQHTYEYRAATLKNSQSESLTLHISWLPRYGPQEMTLHLERVLQEYQPRIAVMTGICAGDAARVQLGDLVVAERTFTYDNGKLVLDEQGRSVHLHDTMTYQLDATLLQYLHLFDEWKPLVARLKRPVSSSGSRKKREVVCHLKPMASGSAVRADHPFEDVRVPMRGTVAIDMEGAAFGLVMSRHPLVPWLVVKGVCDYADGDKNDVYHDYAARASALYALSFLQAYVNTARLPRRDDPSSSRSHDSSALPTEPDSPTKRSGSPQISTKRASSQAGQDAPAPGRVQTATIQRRRLQERRFGSPRPRWLSSADRKVRRRVLLSGFVLLAAAGSSIVGFIVLQRKPSYPTGNTPGPASPAFHPSTLHTPVYIYSATSSITSVTWSPDRKLLASAGLDGTVNVWDAVNGGGPVRTWSDPQHPSSHIWSVAWSPSLPVNHSIVFGGSVPSLKLWNAADNIIARDFAVKGPDQVSAVAWSPNGAWIASGSGEHAVQVWDVLHGGAPLATHSGSMDEVISVAWSPDGTRVVGGSKDGTVRVWRALSEAPLLLSYSHDGPVNGVAWSPDGMFLASASDDKTVIVWDLAKGSRLITYRGHMDDVLTVAYSHDGRYLASGSWDQTVQIWKATTGQLVATYVGQSDHIQSVAWSADNTQLVSASHNKTIHIWENGLYPH